MILQQSMNGMPPSLLDKKYEKICLLGQGSYGSVYLYKAREDHRTTPFQNLFHEQNKMSSDYVAVKIYKKPNTKSQGIDFGCLREITCLQLFEHDNIMNCIEVLYNHKKQSQIPYEIAAVMNYHLQLNALLEKSTFQDKKRVVKQILQGLNHLHSNYYFHRDLKPDNVFVSKEGYIKLADFGFTKEFGTPYKKFTYNACTIEYRAPQVFMETHYYTQKSDIWSIGCMIAYIFMGKPLFQVDGNVPQIDILSQIFYLFGTPTKENWPGFSKLPIKYQFKAEKSKDLAAELGIDPRVAFFLNDIMLLDPSRRPSAAKILQHQFLSGVSSDPFDVRDLYDEKIEKFVQSRGNK